MYLYSSTLDKLEKLPKESVYRTATEALTKQRLEVVESVKPEGFDAWQARVRKVVEEHPAAFLKDGEYMLGKHVREDRRGNVFITSRFDKETDVLEDEWDGEKVTEGELEGTRTAAERASQKDLGERRPAEEKKRIVLEPEPALTAEQ